MFHTIQGVLLVLATLTAPAFALEGAEPVLLQNEATGKWLGSSSREYYYGDYWEFPTVSAESGIPHVLSRSEDGAKVQILSTVLPETRNVLHFDIRRGLNYGRRGDYDQTAWTMVELQGGRAMFVNEAWSQALIAGAKYLALIPADLCFATYEGNPCIWRIQHGPAASH